MNTNIENRNVLLKKVVSGEIPVDKATYGLARAEITLFFRKLDRAIQNVDSRGLQLISDVSVLANKIQSDNSFTFSKRYIGKLRICA
jgi:hypothetical protein